MAETCEICGTTKNIQRHHTSYEPEAIQLLCVDCHKAVHNHGVGKAPGWNSLFEWLKEDAEILFKEGATNKEVANACDISYATASHWRTKLRCGLPKHTGKSGEVINAYLRYEINRELIAIAEERNKMLRKEDKPIRQSTIISEILEEWYKNQKRVMGVE